MGVALIMNGLSMLYLKARGVPMPRVSGVDMLKSGTTFLVLQHKFVSLKHGLSHPNPLIYFSIVFLFFI